MCVTCRRRRRGKSLTVTVEPIHGPPRSADRWVDMEPFFDAYRAINQKFRSPAATRPPANGSRARTDRARYDDTTACILCCVKNHPAAPATARGQLLSGPAWRSSTRTASSSTAATRPPLSARHPQRGRRGVAPPHHVQLHRTCPRGIEVTKAIQEAKRADASVAKSPENQWVLVILPARAAAGSAAAARLFACARTAALNRLIEGDKFGHHERPRGPASTRR